jgi:hypothetical protein
MVVFFLGCMLAFDPELLGPKLVNGGVPMLGLAVVARLILGAWIGHDLRKEFAAPAPPDEGASAGRRGGTEDHPSAP